MSKRPILFSEVVQELVANAEAIEDLEIDALVADILAANRIFVAGAGRSGFVARAFANRLMHLGFTVHFLGDVTTPSIQRGDLLVIGSGSGSTKTLVIVAQTAQNLGVSVATLTIYPDHTIGSIAKTVVRIPGTTNKYLKAGEEGPSLQPMGNVFEQLSWMVYDTVATKLKAITNQAEEMLHTRHANLE